jgi:hypothetical protein
MWTLYLTLLLNPIPGHPTAFVVHAVEADFVSRESCEAMAAHLAASEFEGWRIVQASCAPTQRDV